MKSSSMITLTTATPASREPAKATPVSFLETSHRVRAAVSSRAGLGTCTSTGSPHRDPSPPTGLQNTYSGPCAVQRMPANTAVCPDDNRQFSGLG